MTIERLKDQTDQADQIVVSKVENTLKDTIFEISSRKSKVLALIDKLELKIVCDRARQMGIPDTDIRAVINNGKGVK